MRTKVKFIIEVTRDIEDICEDRIRAEASSLLESLNSHERLFRYPPYDTRISLTKAEYVPTNPIVVINFDGS